jgi:hypothetical protein
MPVRKEKKLNFMAVKKTWKSTVVNLSSDGLKNDMILTRYRILATNVPRNNTGA